MLAELRAHIARDEERFAAQGKLLTKIDTNVQSLLDTRTFHQGVVKTAVWVSSIVATIVSVAATWLRWGK